MAKSNGRLPTLGNIYQKQCVMKQQTRYEQKWKGSLGHRIKKQNLHANLTQKFNLAVYRRRHRGHGNNSPRHSSWRAKKSGYGGKGGVGVEKHVLEHAGA